MEEPFIGEVRPVSFTFPPKGRALCDGLLLPINQNRALFSMLGTDVSDASRITPRSIQRAGAANHARHDAAPDTLAPYPLAAREPKMAPVLAMPARKDEPTCTL